MPMSRLFGGRAVTSRPPITIVPASGVSKPATVIRIVVLPLPLGPSRASEFASPDVEAHAVDGRHRPIGLVQAADADRGARCSSLRCRVHACSFGLRTTPKCDRVLRTRLAMAASTGNAPAAPMLPKLITVPPAGRCQ